MLPIKICGLAVSDCHHKKVLVLVIAADAICHKKQTMACVTSLDSEHFFRFFSKCMSNMTKQHDIYPMKQMSDIPDMQLTMFDATAAYHLTASNDGQNVSSFSSVSEPVSDYASFIINLAKGTNPKTDCIEVRFPNGTGSNVPLTHIAPYLASELGGTIEIRLDRAITYAEIERPEQLVEYDGKQQLPTCITWSMARYFSGVRLSHALLVVEVLEGEMTFVVGGCRDSDRACAKNYFQSENGFHKNAPLTFIADRAYRTPVVLATALQGQVVVIKPGTWYCMYSNVAAVYLSSATIPEFFAVPCLKALQLLCVTSQMTPVEAGEIIYQYEFLWSARLQRMASIWYENSTSLCPQHLRDAQDICR